MIDAILGILYLVSFLIALFAVYTGARVKFDVESFGVWGHFGCVMAALYWPLTIIVVMGWAAWCGVMKASKVASERVEETVSEYREAWEDTKP